jgi:hypothetical protein
MLTNGGKTSRPPSPMHMRAGSRAAWIGLALMLAVGACAFYLSVPQKMAHVATAQDVAHRR